MISHVIAQIFIYIAINCEATGQYFFIEVGSNAMKKINYLHYVSKGLLFNYQFKKVRSPYRLDEQLSIASKCCGSGVQLDRYKIKINSPRCNGITGYGFRRSYCPRALSPNGREDIQLSDLLTLIHPGSNVLINQALFPNLLNSKCVCTMHLSTGNHKNICMMYANCLGAIY